MDQLKIADACPMLIGCLRGHRDGNLCKRLSQGLISLERGEIKYVPAEGYKLRERASIAITHVYHQLNR